MSRPLTFYEFFAGGGMARLGLGEGWRCAFANDFDAVKANTYRANFPDAEGHFLEGDVWALSAADLPSQADLAWASSPCQDFSLAGARAGLKGTRSSAFFGFWRLVEALAAEGRAPRTVVVENVVGLLTSHDGRDFQALCAAMAEQGYRYGAILVDAAAFLPQSRSRLLMVAVRDDLPRAEITAPAPGDRLLRRAFDRLPPELRDRWVWWDWPARAGRNTRLADLLEPDDAIRWRSDADTARLVAQMTPALRRDLLAPYGARRIGAAYRRMRVEHGVKVQRAEPRFDGLAGCLRTPKGGSSRQFVILAEDGCVRSRLLTSREGARLMGLPDSYRLPASETAAWTVVGDGVAVPVVRHLAAHLLEPLLAPTSAERTKRSRQAA